MSNYSTYTVVFKGNLTQTKWLKRTKWRERKKKKEDGPEVRSVFCLSAVTLTVETWN